MATVPDFKAPNGQWIRYYQNEHNKRVYTRAGMLWGNICNRTKIGGACQKKNACYVGCTNDFADFDEFADWCQTQVGYLEGYQADKDILSKDCKSYSPNTVVFIPQELNKLLVNRSRDRGEYPIGVSWSTDRNLFAAYCNDGCGKTVPLGRYSDVATAFSVYKIFKEDTIKRIANKWKSQIDPRAFNALLAYQVEITD